MNLGQTNPWEPDSIGPGRPLGRWTSRSPSGEPSAPGTSTTSLERGSGWMLCLLHRWEAWARARAEQQLESWGHS